VQAKSPQTDNSKQLITPNSLVSALPSVTPALFLKLKNNLNISTVADLIWKFPVRYEDRSRFTPIAALQPGQPVTICGEVVGVQTVPTRSRLLVNHVLVRDQTGVAYLVFFGAKHIKTTFEKLMGREIVAYGKSSLKSLSRRIEIVHVEWELSDEDDSPLAAGRIAPVYALTEGVTQARMRRIVWQALSSCAGQLADPLPRSILERYDLIGFETAINEAHFPTEWMLISIAQKRLVFFEFFCLQLILIHRKNLKSSEQGISFSNIRSAVDELENALPFTLTSAQRRVISEIGDDMQAPRPMNRLVHGDVGSGKTAVAMAAMLIAVRNGRQTAIMAPTEILAEQHFITFSKALEDLGVQTVFLSGSMNEKSKNLNLQAIAGGEAHVAVGTHALIQEGVSFHSLGLVVIDEQHRFGVLQRDALRQKGDSPDTLVMTATPIPRTLTLTLYGDLDVSMIDELPPGRKPVRTHWKKSSQRLSVYETVRPMLAQGRQAYVICPLIEESEKLQAQAAVDLAESLTHEIYPEFRIGLVHGQMKSAEKDDVMERFRRRDLDVLVSTTVIEVGVDVPNASIIVIEDADRFGLAQLHQLRGRVGRGNIQSYCILISDPKSAEGEARMKIMTEHNNGFVIAEEDLKLRGPGEFYGTRQSGIQDLPFLDVFRDVPILKQARDEAIDFLSKNPKLAGDDLLLLREQVHMRVKRMAQSAGSN
jgi:ATP-dependent DNA helicase RecG